MEGSVQRWGEERGEGRGDERVGSYRTIPTSTYSSGISSFPSTIRWGRGNEDRGEERNTNTSRRIVMNSRLRRKNTGSRHLFIADRQRLEKRRIYCCCICDALNIQGLHDYLVADFFAATTWTFHLIGDTLRLYKASATAIATAQMKPTKSEQSQPILPGERERVEFEESEVNADLGKCTAHSPQHIVHSA